MCHIALMMKLNMKAISLVTAITLGVVPSAIAQSDTPAEEAGIPYAITFDGAYYPANLETIAYPHTAATLNKDGECMLNVMTDQSGAIADMSIIECSDISFRDVASRFIRSQTFPSDPYADLSVSKLKIKWDIGAEPPAPLTLQIATR